MALLLFLPLVQAAVVSEDFENDVPPAAPAESWYTYSSAGSGEFRVSTAGNLGASTVNYLQNSSSGAGNFALVLAEIDDYAPCDLIEGNAGSDDTLVSAGNPPTSANFSFRIDGTLDATYQSFGWLADASSTSQGFYLDFNVTDVRLRIFGDDTTGTGALTLVTDTSSALGLTLSTGTWYNVTWTISSCDVFGNPPELRSCATGGASPDGAVTADETHSIYFKDQDLGLSQTSSTVVCFNVGNALPSSSNNLLNWRLISADAFDWRFDNWNVTTLTAAQVFGAASTASAGNIVDFDVDPFGQTVIIRNDSATNVQQVRTYRGSNLAVAGSDTSVTCPDGNAGPGIFSMGPLVAYVNCDGTQDPDFLRIRTSSMGTPTFGACANDPAPATDCPSDVELTLGSSNFVDNDDFWNLDDVAFFPIDYSGDDATVTRYFAFVYTTTTGKIGVATYTHAGQAAATDRRNQDTAEYSADAPDDVCSWAFDHDGDGTSTLFIAVVDSGSPTQVYSAAFTFVSENLVRELHVALDLFNSYGAAQSNAIGVDCGEDRIAVYGADGPVSVVNLTTGNEFFSAEVVDDATEGIALSTDGAFMAYCDATAGTIVDVDAASDVGEFTCLASPMRGMDMDFRGSLIYQANTGTVTITEVRNVTCISSCGIGSTSVPGAVSGDVTTGAGEGVFADASTNVGASLGIGDFGGQVFLAAIVIFGGVISGVGTVSFSRNGAVMGIGAAVGAIVGVLLAWGFGILSDGAIFTVVVLALILIVAFVFFRRGG